MPVADEVVDKARGGDRASVEAVITECYPAVHRVAHALTGDPAVAGKVVRFVLRLGVTVMPRWRSGLIPENWFYHNTLITLRRLKHPIPPTDQDLLVTAGPATIPAYVAFVRALRALPSQQVEAYLLHHGERLNERLLGVAMDLSTGAAGAHLVAATDALKALAGEEYANQVAALEKAYTSLSPPETLVKTSAHTEIRSVLWGQRIRRAIRRLIKLAILGAAGYFAWRYRVQLRQTYELLRQAATTAMTRPS